MQAQQTTPPTEEELRIGFGTLQAVQAFEKWISSQRVPGQILLAVNIATLLRNNIGTVAYVDGQKFVDKTAKPALNSQAIVAKTKDVMVDVANEVARICETKFKGYTHHILYYLTNPYKQIPGDWIRITKSEAAQKLDLVTTAFIRAMQSGDQVNGNVHMHIRLADKMKVPSYLGLTEVLKEFAPYTVPFSMISHMPLDYHVANYSGRKGILYRSHTGEAVPMTPSALGKAVFKEDEVPFYPITHMLLGDKYLIKGCLEKKAKSDFLERARREHWGVRTSDYISNKVIEYGIKLPYRLP